VAAMQGLVLLTKTVASTEPRTGSSGLAPLTHGLHTLWPFNSSTASSQQPSTSHTHVTGDAAQMVALPIALPRLSTQERQRAFPGADSLRPT